MLTACVKIFDYVMREFCNGTRFNDEHEQCLKTNIYFDYIVSVISVFYEAGYRYEFYRYRITAGFRYMLPRNCL